MEILRILFSGAKGKKAATVLIALHRLNLLILPERGKQQIYEAINKTFHLSLGNQSYQPNIIFTKKGIETKIDEIEIQEVMKKIE